MPLGDLEDEAMAKVLIVAQDQVLIENLKRELPAEKAFRTSTAASGFEAGIQAESFHPDCIIVDFSIGQRRSTANLPEPASQQRLRRNDLDRPAAGRRHHGELRSLEHQRDVQEAFRRRPAGRTTANPHRCEERVGLTNRFHANRLRRQPIGMRYFTTTRSQCRFAGG